MDREEGKKFCCDFSTLKTEQNIKAWFVLWESIKSFLQWSTKKNKQNTHLDQWNITDILEIDPYIWLVDFQQRH